MASRCVSQAQTITKGDLLSPCLFALISSFIRKTIRNDNVYPTHVYYLRYILKFIAFYTQNTCCVRDILSSLVVLGRFIG